jgi:membrane protein implicated in regulation of membrane protease activity
MSAPMRARTVVRYTLFQIPDLILLSLGLAAAVRWWGLPVIAAYGLVAAWIIKDVILFPILRIAYESDGSDGPSGVRGALGVVTQPLAPTGYVRLGSELWRAELASGSGSAAVGSSVRVVAVRGLTLVVEPEATDEP